MFNHVIITLFLFNILKLLSSYYFVHLSYFPTSTSVLNGLVSHIWGKLCQWRSSAPKSGGGHKLFSRKSEKQKKKKKRFTAQRRKSAKGIVDRAGIIMLFSFIKLLGLCAICIKIVLKGGGVGGPPPENFYRIRYKIKQF